MPQKATYQVVGRTYRAATKRQRAIQRANELLSQRAFESIHNVRAFIRNATDLSRDDYTFKF